MKTQTHRTPGTCTLASALGYQKCKEITEIAKSNNKESKEA